MKLPLIGILLLALACSSEKTQSPPSIKNQPVPQSDSGALTQVGENQMGRFSPDGSKIIYQSRNRPTHQSAQIYSMTLSTKREKRLTYNDGDDYYPSFGPSGKHILYSSTTDEIKEHPSDSFKGLLKAPDTTNQDPADLFETKAPFEEVYEADSDGSHIERITQNAGFDGEPIYSPDGRRVIFVRQKESQFEILSADIRGRYPFSLLKSDIPVVRPSLSPDGKTILFVSRDGANGSAQIKISDPGGKNAQSLTSGNSVNRDPSFTPDGKLILFSSNREKNNIYSLYLINSDGSCLRKISINPIPKPTKDFFADLYPVVSPDGKKLLFTSNRSGSYQLYLVDFVIPEACLTNP